MAEFVRVTIRRDPIHGIREDTRQIRSALARHTRLMESALTPIFRIHAPKRTRRLAESIEGKVSYRSKVTMVRIIGGAVDKGFAYLDVTRFGHRRAVITPKHSTVLKIPVGARHIFARSVQGYRPTHDWVESALAEGEKVTGALERRLDRRITTILASG